MINLPALARAFDSRELSMFHLGVLLRDKIPLPQALRQIAISAENKRIKTAAARAAELLASGHSPEEVFAGSETIVFPAQCRYILATPLSEELKGQLLSGWNREKSAAFALTQHLLFPFQTLVIGSMAMVALITFVLPQFREILLGLNIHEPGIAGQVINFASSADAMLLAMFFPIFMAMLLAAAFYAGKSIFHVFVHYEELSLFRMLNAVSAEHRMRVLEVMAVSHNFPKLAVKLKAFARAVNSGEDIVPASSKVGLDSFVSWFIQLAADEEHGSILLTQGSELLETRVNSGLERAGRLLEIFSVLVQGVTFGLITYSVFRVMVTIMLGAIE